MPVVKALIAGSCGGNVDTLLKRAAAVNASKGPFDVLFCVGQFFDSKGTWRDELCFEEGGDLVEDVLVGW